MFQKHNFIDGDLLNAEKLNEIEDGIVEAGAVKEGYYYELLMKDATFTYSSTADNSAKGSITGNSLFTMDYFDKNSDKAKWMIILDNGVNKYALEGNSHNTQSGKGIKYHFENVSYLFLLNGNDNTYWDISIPVSIYNEKNGDVKVSVLCATTEEKTLVKENFVPVAKPLILDSTMSYSQLPFKGDEALQAILDGRQILIKVPNASGGTLYANYMPIFQYQLPDQNNNYLSLLYLKDGLGNNLVTALGALMQGGAPDFSTVYGQLDLPLSKTYTETPLK